jgi:hypothetical protein
VKRNQSTLRIVATLILFGSAVLIGACLPAPASTDWPSDTPALAGTWALMGVPDPNTGADTRLADIELDQNGDPRDVTLNSDLVTVALPFTIPVFVLDGQIHTVEITGTPVVVSYVGQAKTSKGGVKTTITVGDTVSSEFHVDLYVEVPLVLSQTLVGSADLTYDGSFTGPDEAVGSAHIVATPGQTALEIIQMLGLTIPQQDLDQTTPNVRLVRQ